MGLCNLMWNVDFRFTIICFIVRESAENSYFITPMVQMWSEELRFSLLVCLWSWGVLSDQLASNKKGSVQFAFKTLG